MTDALPAAHDENAAWVSVELPWPPEQVFAFVADVERLFRLNPHFEIECWEAPPALHDGALIHCRVHNELSDIRHDLNASVTAWQPGSRYRLEYSTGLKQATEVTVEPRGSGSLLTLRDEYPTVDAADDEALKEVDRSITPWGVAIRRRVLGLRRGRWLPGYWRFSEGFWLAMPPRHRRISRLIIWSTIFEFALFVFVFAIYWLERLRPAA